MNFHTFMYFVGQLNYLLHFDGNENDIERWKSQGAKYWNAESMLHMDKYHSEDNYCDSYEENTCSNKNSPNSVIVFHVHLRNLLIQRFCIF